MSFFPYRRSGTPDTCRRRKYPFSEANTRGYCPVTVIAITRSPITPTLITLPDLSTPERRVAANARAIARDLAGEGCDQRASLLSLRSAVSTRSGLPAAKAAMFSTVSE